MPIYGIVSLKNLETCDERLQIIAKEIIKEFDVSIIWGHRKKETQDAYFFAGLSEKKWPNSKHNTFPSLAFDAIPYPTRYSKIKPFYYMAGSINSKARSLGIKLRWGGDFNSDNNFYNDKWLDLAHFEIVD